MGHRSIIHFKQNYRRGPSKAIQPPSPLNPAQGAHTHIGNKNFITRDFYDRYEKIITALSRATNFRLDADFSRFIDLTAGDVRLVDVSFAYISEGKDTVYRIPCLWLFASKLLARIHARESQGPRSSTP